jgi:hypothetical protein
MNVRLRHDMMFVAGVYYGNEMRMNTYTLRLWLTTNHVDPARHNIAFERIKYFVYHELDSTILINSAHQEQCEHYVKTGLRVTTMPGEPVDQLVGLMLYYKLNAIMEDCIVIDETEISSTMGDNMVYLHCTGETTSIDHPDWWTSADTVHCDLDLINRDNVVIMPKANAWRDLDLDWPTAEATEQTGNIVVFADFKQNNETK